MLDFNTCRILWILSSPLNGGSDLGSMAFFGLHGLAYRLHQNSCQQGVEEKTEASIKSNDPDMAMCCATNSAFKPLPLDTAFAMSFVSKFYRAMAYFKIYSRTEIETDSLIPHLRFDYKCEDDDSAYSPNPTFEYFYDDDSELQDSIEASNEEWIEANGVFCENCHWIFGMLDALKIEYKYDMENGGLRNPDHPKYKEGRKCALANFC